MAPIYIPPQLRAARFLDLPHEIIILISRFLSTKSLLNFLLVNREINTLCTLILETPHPNNGDLQRAIAWHAMYQKEEKLYRILKNSKRELMKHQGAQFDALTYCCGAGFTITTQWLLDIGIHPDITNPEPERDTPLKQRHCASPLLGAAMANNGAIVAQLLMTKAELTMYGLDDVMRLLFGVPEQPRDLHIAKMLVAAGINLQMRDIHGTTTLHYAAAEYNGPEVRFLVENGVDLNVRGAGGSNALAYAIKAGNFETMEALLDLGLRLDVICHFTWFPMHTAAKSGGADVVEYLLSAGADPNIINGVSGYTPLYYASLAEDDDAEKVALAILKAGGSFRTDVNSTKAIMIRAIEDQWHEFLHEAFKSLQTREEPVTVPDIFFIAAASMGNIGLMQALHSSLDVDFEYKTLPAYHWGWSALGEAVKYGGDDAVEWIIQRARARRFDFLDVDRNNLYYIAFALPHPKRERTIQLLLKHFEPDEVITPNRFGITPLEVRQPIGRFPKKLILHVTARIPPIGFKSGV
ncbi:ankyrin repeat-containing domain protein [Aspergillus granulosus]|uniref:Ankyrin repeat-containing domain protein n=1 Tax=Aspergillus granulosus TaxID=176169 RepID=A0ABR4GSA6_9EURO